MAHRFAARQRNTADWYGSPLETALAAAAGSEHPPLFREASRAALDRLLDWASSGEVRQTSEDAAALALTARAAAALATRDVALATRAADAVAHIASSTRPVPQLHLALAALALDNQIADRDQRPWPELCQSSLRTSALGVDEGLRQLTLAIASGSPKPADLIQGLLSVATAQPSVADAVVLLWVLVFAIRRLVEDGTDDAGLTFLISKRDELIEFLAVEVSSDSFEVPPFGEYDPFVQEPPGLAAAHLTLFEALLLDHALPPPPPGDPWLSAHEANARYGAQARHAYRVGAVLTAVGAILAGAVGWLASLVAGWDELFAAGVAFAVGAIGLIFAVWRWQKSGPSRFPRKEAIGLLVGIALAAGLDIANQTKAAVAGKPLFSDAYSLYAAIVFPVVIVLTQKLGERHD